MKEMQKHGKVGLAADRSGMDRKTARKYVRAGKLPSELEQPRWWRTRKDPIAAEDWALVEALARQWPQRPDCSAWQVGGPAPIDGEAATPPASTDHAR